MISLACQWVPPIRALEAKESLPPPLPPLALRFRACDLKKSDQLSSRTFFFGGRKGKEGLQLMKSGKSLPISFVRLLAGMRG